MKRLCCLLLEGAERAQKQADLADAMNIFDGLIILICHAVATQGSLTGDDNSRDSILGGNSDKLVETPDILRQIESYQSTERASSEGQEATRAMIQMSAISADNCKSNEYLARFNLLIQSDRTSSDKIKFLKSQRDKQLSVCEKVFRDELEKISDHHTDEDLKDIQSLREAVIKTSPKIQSPQGSEPIESNFVKGIIRFMEAKRGEPFDIRIIRNQNIGKRYVNSEYKRLVVDLCDTIRPDIEPITVFYESLIEAESDIFAKMDLLVRNWLVNLRICRLVQLRVMEISEKIFKVLLK